MRSILLGEVGASAAGRTAVKGSRPRVAVLLAVLLSSGVTSSTIATDVAAPDGEDGDGLSDAFESLGRHRY